MYKLKFTKLPKAIKKHLKENNDWQKFYALGEIDQLFNQAITGTQVTGNYAVAIICPAGEPEYEFQLEIDKVQLLSDQVLEDFDSFLNTKQAELETLYLNVDKNKDKIKSLEDDILILTNRAKEIREEFDGVDNIVHEQNVDDERQETEVVDAIVEEVNMPILDDGGLFDDIEEPAQLSVREMFFKTEEEIEEELDLPHTPDLEPVIKQETTTQITPEPSNPSEEKIQNYLDVSTFEAVKALEAEIEKIDGQIKKGVDRYLFDELYLTSATDFASTEKRELIKTKHLSQAHQTFQSMRDWAKRSLEEITSFSLTQLTQKHDELSALKVSTRKQRVTEMAEMLKVTFDKKKNELRKEIIQKRDAEIAEMEAVVDSEKDEKLAVEIEKIDQSLTKGFNANHEKALLERRVEVAKIAEEKAQVVFETIDQGYTGLLDEIKANLVEHEKAIETRYQLYREEKVDQRAKEFSNKELELRTRQIEIEEKRLAQNNETKALSGQVEQLKMMIEKNRLENQMQIMSRDKEEQAKEMRRFKRLVGVSFIVMTVAMAGVVSLLI